MADKAFDETYNEEEIYDENADAAACKDGVLF